MNDVVQNESIIAFNAVNLDTIKNMPDIKTARECLARLSGFQKALEEADKFFGMSVAFAKLEAAALIRTIELGGKNAIKGDRGHAAEWLFKMSEKERDAVISKCEGGLTITQIYRMEMKPAVGLDRIGIEAKGRKDQYLSDAEEMGIIDISDFVDSKIEESKKPSVQMLWFGQKKALRDTLLKNGFVGCGFDSQIYVDPERSDQTHIYDAIATRLLSICTDIERLEDIAHSANIMMKDLPKAKDIIRRYAEQYSKEVC